MRPWLYPVIGAVIGCAVGVVVAQFVASGSWSSAIVGGFTGIGAALGLSVRRSRGLG